MHCVVVFRRQEDGLVVPAAQFGPQLGCQRVVQVEFVLRGSRVVRIVPGRGEERGPGRTLLLVGVDDIAPVGVSLGG